MREIFTQVFVAQTEIEIIIHKDTPGLGDIITFMKGMKRPPGIIGKQIIFKLQITEYEAFLHWAKGNLHQTIPIPE